MKPRLSVAALAVLLCLGITSAVAHQSHAPVTLDHLTRNALAIVEGRVLDVKAEWNAGRTQIHTTVRIAVDSFLKGGDESSKVVELRLLGGVAEDEALAVIGQPEFTVGEDVVVFLRSDWESSRTPVVAMEHGKFVVATEAKSRTEILVNGVGESFPRAAALTEIRSINAAQK